VKKTTCKSKINYIKEHTYTYKSTMKQYNENIIKTQMLVLETILTHTVTHTC